MQVSVVILIFVAVAMGLLWLIVSRATRKCLSALSTFDYRTRVNVMRRQIIVHIFLAVVVVVGFVFGAAKLVAFVVSG
jgi:hypothetical protein